MAEENEDDNFTDDYEEENCDVDEDGDEGFYESMIRKSREHDAQLNEQIDKMGSEFMNKLEEISNESRHELKNISNGMYGQQNSMSVASHLSMFYGYKESNNATVLSKEIVQNSLWVFFMKADNNGGPYFGFLTKNVSENVRQNLKAILGRISNEHSGEIIEKGNLIYKVWINTGVLNESQIIIDTLKELESQTQKVLYG